MSSMEQLSSREWLFALSIPVTITGMFFSEKNLASEPPDSTSNLMLWFKVSLAVEI